MTTNILDIQNLDAGYKSQTVLHRINIHVEEGECVAVLGANGAGKSTLLRAISGMISTSGKVLLAGRDITALSPSAIARAGISHVPEGRGTLKALTVEENLRVGSMAQPGGTSRTADMDRCFELFPILHTRRHAQATSLSGGEQQMLAVARALMAKPKLIMLDEPSFGLAPKIVQTVYDVIASIIKDSGVSVLVVEQSVDLALSLARRAYVLRLGRVALEDDAQSIKGSSDLSELYLS